MTSAPASGGRRGFTLIELLVSISIIALLIGILFPALGAARRAGQRTQCLSNLRSIGQGARLYMDAENSGIYPFVLPLLPPSFGGNPLPGGGPFENTNDESLLDVLDGYLDAARPQRDLVASTKDNTLWNAEFPYRCPNDTGFPDAAEDADTVPVYRSWGTSYAFAPGVVMAFATGLVPPNRQQFIPRYVTQVNRAYTDEDREFPFLTDGGDFHPSSSGPSQMALFISDGRAEPLERKNDPIELGEEFVIDVVTRAGLPGAP